MSFGKPATRAGWAQHLTVVGFSQGACIAIEYALRRPERCGAIVVFTGALMGRPETKWKGRLNGLKIFLTGSDAGEWVTEAATRQTARELCELGANVTLRIYAGRPHIVADEEVADARGFLERNLIGCG